MRIGLDMLIITYKMVFNSCYFDCGCIDPQPSLVAFQIFGTGSGEPKAKPTALRRFRFLISVNAAIKDKNAKSSQTVSYSRTDPFHLLFYRANGICPNHIVASGN